MVALRRLRQEKHSSRCPGLHTEILSPKSKKKKKPKDKRRRSPNNLSSHIKKLLKE
jgi:hypothetical protein